MPSRAELLEVAQELPRLGLVERTEGNASVRFAGGILITPSAQPYDEMAEADLVLLEPGGGVREGRRPPSSEWRVHVAIYAARPDVGAIVHTHSPAATAWSRKGAPLTGPGEVLTAPFAETGTTALGELAVEALGDRRAVLLADHGVVAVGAMLREALAVAVDVERCVTQLTQAKP